MDCHTHSRAREVRCTITPLLLRLQPSRSGNSSPGLPLLNLRTLCQVSGQCIPDRLSSNLCFYTWGDALLPLSYSVIRHSSSPGIFLALTRQQRAHTVCSTKQARQTECQRCPERKSPWSLGGCQTLRGADIQKGRKPHAGARDNVDCGRSHRP
jgi:hypothetical protein